MSKSRKLGNYEAVVYFDTLNDAISGAEITGGNMSEVVTTGYSVAGDLGACTYLLKTTAQAAADGDIIDGYGNHSTLSGANALVIKDSSSVLFTQYGATSTTNSTNTARMLAAIAQGYKEILIPELPGTQFYAFETVVTIALGSVITRIAGIGQPELKLTVASSSSIFTVTASKQFLTIENLKLTSSGTLADAYFTYGIILSQASYCFINNVYAIGFSGAAFELRQCVNITLNDLVPQSSNIGISSVLVAGAGTTTLYINRPYISNCNDGIYLLGGVAYTINDPICENCNDAGVAGRAGFNFYQANKVTVANEYHESNGRNRILYDSNVTFTGNQIILGGDNPDVVTYVNVAGADRGLPAMNNTGLSIRSLQPDSLAGIDLEIGTNIVAKNAGGSVEYGKNTTDRYIGTAVNATWTSIITLTGQTDANVGDRKTYDYSVYAGFADLSTGYDSGYILNGVIYSHTGTVPAWLRINSNDLQVFITSSSYGLFWGLNLNTTNGIGA